MQKWKAADEGKFDIQIKQVGGKTITMTNCSPSDTIHKVKLRLSSIMGFCPITSQRLFLFGGVLLKDEETLGERNIRREVLIYLLFRQVIEKYVYITVVDFNGNEKILKVSTKDSVLDIKRQSHFVNYIPSASFRFTSNGRMLQDHKTVQDYPIKNGSIVTAVWRLRGGMENNNYNNNNNNNKNNNNNNNNNTPSSAVKPVIKETVIMKLINSADGIRFIKIYAHLLLILIL